MTWCFNCLYCISPLLILLWVYIDRSERDLVKKADPTAGRREMAILVEWQQVPTVTVAQLFDWRKKNGHKNIFAWNWILMAYLLLWNCPDHYKLLFFCHLLKCFTNWCHFNMFYSCFWISKWTLKKILIFLLTMILCIDLNCFCFVFKYWNLLPYI